ADHGGHVVQRIMSVDSLRLERLDWRGLLPNQRRTAVTRRAAEEARRPFDLANGPLLRAELIELGDTEHVLVLTVHHIVFDGWSMGILLREALAAYEARHARRPPSFPELPVQYADYAAWQRASLCGDALNERVSYWRERLEGAAALELPTDFVRPAAP